MDQKPYILTAFALARLLKEFALELGLSETLADVTAQVHFQRSTIPTTWSEFFAGNCAECALNPEECPFLNPTKAPPEATPADVKAANAMMIELGRVEHCPSWEPISGLNPA